MRIATKRVYEKPSAADGSRVLVDRLWPRGLTKAGAKIDLWLRDVAPSDELRKWIHAQPAAWSIFRKRYLKELTSDEAGEALQTLYKLASQRRRLTLLYASRNEERNNATVLKELMEGSKKPPTGTGPGVVAQTARLRKAVRPMR